MARTLYKDMTLEQKIDWLAQQVVEQRRWIMECSRLNSESDKRNYEFIRDHSGRILDNYYVAYGGTLQSGDGGRAIYDADMAALKRWETELARYDAKHPVLTGQTTKWAVSITVARHEVFHIEAFTKQEVINRMSGTPTISIDSIEAEP